MEQKKRKPIIRIAAGAFFLALLAAFVLRAGYVLIPERPDYGATWNMYLQEPEDSVDVLFFGTSMAYCDVVPAVIYEETGLASYVMAGPEQTFSITYDYIREALKTQRPSVIFVELTGIVFDRYMEFTAVNVGYMPYFSANRLEATLYAAEPAERFGLLFPLYNYHDRWGDPRALFRPRADETLDPMAGYTVLLTAEPQAERLERGIATSEEDFLRNVEYLHKIQALCEREGVRLVLFQVPSCGYIAGEWMARIRAAAGADAELVDFNPDFAAMGLDPASDFYDIYHCNLSGAEKFSRALAAYIAENCEIQPAPHDAALWQWRAEAFAERRAALDTGYV